MKKLLVIAMAIALCVPFSGCGQNPNAKASSVLSSSSKGSEAMSSEQASSGAIPSAISSIATAKRDLPEKDYKSCGKGSFSISTPSGTSENGNVPIIYIGKDEATSYGLGFSARGFDGSKLSYEYIDGYLISKNQISDEDSSIYAKANNLTNGKHKVEIVQYGTNKPEGKIVTYKSAFYEVKPK